MFGNIEFWLQFRILAVGKTTMAKRENGLYIIQGEVNLLVTEMRRNSRWMSHGHQVHQVRSVLWIIVIIISNLMTIGVHEKLDSFWSFGKCSSSLMCSPNLCMPSFVLFKPAQAALLQGMYSVKIHAYIQHSHDLSLHRSIPSPINTVVVRWLLTWWCYIYM